MKYQKIPDIKARKNKKNVSWIENKDFVLSIKDWAKKTGESKYSSKYIPISNINTRLSITSNAFVQFVSKYLCTHQPELAYNKIKI